MHHRLTIILLTLLTSLSTGWAGSLQLKQVPQDVRWLAHLDVRTMLTGQVGNYMMSELNKEGADNKMEAFKAVFNFDPRQDIDGLTAFGMGGSEDEGTLIVHGRFDRERLITLLKANDTYRESAYRNYTVHEWVDDHKQERSYGCFAPDGSVVMSNRRVSLEKALDVLQGMQPNLSQGGGLDLSAVTGAPSFVAVADYGAISGVDPKAAMFRQAKTGSLAIGESQGQINMRMTLEAADAATATQLQAIAQGLIALTMLGAQENPELARLAQAAQVSLQDNQVSMTISYPATDMIRLMQEAEARKQAQTQGAL